jgi:NAD-dependent SIR2 family protein deacetylase
MSLAPESIVLLGAGASKEAGVPTTFEATRQLVERIASRPRDQSFASALHFVCGALLAYDAADGTSPFNSLDVERVFAAVQLLAERRTLEVTPFVASWHPAVDALDQPPRNAPMGFDRNLIDGIARGRGIHSPERMITQLIESVTKTGGRGQTYMGLAQRMLTELRQLVATTSKDVGYLTPLVSQSEQAKCLTIATLNYDLAIEGAGMLGGVVVTTGIDDWISTGRWTWPSDGIRLLKLHGSIDWAWQPEQPIDGQLPRGRVVVTDTPVDDLRPPVVVFGQRGKLRAEGPFLGLLAEFEKQLAVASRLIVIGYSFRDDHVNELIRRWIAEDIDRTVLVVDPAWPEHFNHRSDDFRAELNRYLVPSTWKQQPTFAPRLEVWREPCSAALEKLAS